MLGIAALLIGLVVTGCGEHAPQAAPPPPVVSVVQPIAREVIEWDEYIGRLESPETVEIRARVSGYLDKVHFKEGKEVKTGDLLFTIDPRPYQAEFDHADAEYQRALSQAELAKNDSERAKRLIATKAISEEDFDTKAKTYAAALAAVRSARAATDSAKLNLEFTEIRAPIDGRNFPHLHRCHRQCPRSHLAIPRRFCVVARTYAPPNVHCLLLQRASALRPQTSSRGLRSSEAWGCKRILLLDWAKAVLAVGISDRASLGRRSTLVAFRRASRPRTLALKPRWPFTNGRC
ncbi:MAG: efflux RND transporter periplasmic adaptor subunit [Gammaproteobacteria bacterium]|nr:efflux RND transporter periplasmic adaptor subunit [Gammaproteobacteria bacterium]